VVNCVKFAILDGVMTHCSLFLLQPNLTECLMKGCCCIEQCRCQCLAC